MIFNSNQDIYKFAMELQQSLKENNYFEVSEAITKAMGFGFTASEQLGELRLVFVKIRDGWGNPSPDLKCLIDEAIEAINNAFRRKK